MTEYPSHLTEGRPSKRSLLHFRKMVTDPELYREILYSLQFQEMVQLQDSHKPNLEQLLRGPHSPEMAYLIDCSHNPHALIKQIAYHLELYAKDKSGLIPLFLFPQ